jgi:hypothetical protein
MTIHLRSLPHDLRDVVLSNRVFQDALRVALGAYDRQVLHRHVLRLNAETRVSVEAAKIHLMFHGGRPDLPLASWFRSAAQREAQHALAAACGRTLLVDRIEAQWDGPDAIRALRTEVAGLAVRPAPSMMAAALSEAAPFAD